MEFKHIESLCRVCLNVGAFPLFNKCEGLRVCDKVAACIKTEIEDSDGLPKMICANCLNDLCAAYNFIQRWEESMKFLLKLSHSEPVVVPNSQAEQSARLKQEVEFNGCDNEDDSQPAPVEPREPETSTKRDQAEIQYFRKKTRKYNKRRDTVNICPYCGKIFSYKSILEVHLRKHTGERPFRCSYCKSRFSQNSLLRRHIQICHMDRERKFMCETCGMKFFTKNAIKIHIRRHTGEKPYSCPYCSQRFSQISALIRHKRTHTKEKLYSCHICSKSFASSSSVTSHLLVHSDEKNFSCHICNQTFKCKKNLQVHIKRHTDPTNHMCHFCGTNFSAKGNLKKHIETMHSERSGQCKVCGKSVPDVEKHMIRHSSHKPYKCDVCPKAFTILQSLQKHKTYKHENAVKYRCSITNCNKTFPIMPMLEFHMLKYHKNQTPFVCSHCARGFFRLSDLSRHLKVTHNEVLPKNRKRGKSTLTVN